MKLSADKLDVIKSHEFETVQYGVDASNLPLLFQLLRTNLYSDLHGSIIRELVSNVIDSHTEAGTPDAIGEVEWIPSSKILGVDCQLIVRDFGVGLSPERMKTIYGNYLSSTKREGNSQIGGFGLGSKAPFAYTDSFSVQTVFDKVKYRYLCYIDETQLGAISLLTRSVVDEPNNTEIIIPIKDEQRDFQLFQVAINTQLAYFRTIKYKGFKTPDRDIKFENEFCVVKAEPPIQNLHIVLGNVAYAIDFKALGYTDFWKFNESGFNNCGIGLKFDIGELQPTMSRESLYWNQKTKDKVMDRINKAKRTVRNQIEAELGGEKDYAKWYAYASSGRSASFPNQFQFANLKRDAEYTTDKGRKLQITPKTADWFSGHNVREVRPFSGGRRRKGTTSNPDYQTSMPEHYDFTEGKPVFRLERNLNSSACLYLFNKYPNGFIVVSHLGKPEDRDYMPYYEETKKWMAGLESYDDLDIPEEERVEGDEHMKAYREMVKQRKLEGKFTAKILRQGNNPSSKPEVNFIYNMHEAKFSDVHKATVIYGFQHEHEKLAKITAMLLQDDKMHKRFNGWYDSAAGKTMEADFFVFKIGQNYEKHFFALPNAYHVDEVLKLETPLKKTLASIATALRIKPFIHEYHILQYFNEINLEMCNRYKEVHKFVEQYATRQTFAAEDLQKELLTICQSNLDEAAEAEWQTIKDYLDGADLLKTVNFAMYSDEHTGGFYSNKGGDGTTSFYLKRWVKQSKAFIEQYLDWKGRPRDGGPSGKPVMVTGDPLRDLKPEISTVGQILAGLKKLEEGDEEDEEEEEVIESQSIV